MSKISSLLRTTCTVNLSLPPAESHQSYDGGSSVRCLYLPRPLQVDGDDLESVAAKLAGPAASLADPLQQTLLMGVADRAVAPTRVQQVALQARRRDKEKLV